MKRLIGLMLAVVALVASTDAVPQAGRFWGVKYLLTGVDLTRYPLFIVPDDTPNGTPAYMATKTFTVYLGEFATQGECLAYAPPATPTFSVTFDIGGVPLVVTMVSGGNMTATSYGCGDRNYS